MIQPGRPPYASSPLMHEFGLAYFPDYTVLEDAAAIVVGAMDDDTGTICFSCFLRWGGCFPPVRGRPWLDLCDCAIVRCLLFLAGPRGYAKVPPVRSLAGFPLPAIVLVRGHGWLMPWATHPGQKTFLTD